MFLKKIFCLGLLLSIHSITSIANTKVLVNSGATKVNVTDNSTYVSTQGTNARNHRKKQKSVVKVNQKKNTANNNTEVKVNGSRVKVKVPGVDIDLW